MKQFIRIIKDCVGYERNRYNLIVSKVQLYKDEIYEVMGVYNYYGHDSKNVDQVYWNTEQPVAGVNVIDEESDSQVYYLYEIPPLCACYTTDSYVTNLTLQDLLVREYMHVTVNWKEIQDALRQVFSIYDYRFNFKLPF